jgi:hypothetical protein
VLRATWRDYAGMSSSPKGSVPQPTAAGTRLQMPSEVQGVEVRPAQVPSEVQGVEVRPAPSEVQGVEVRPAPVPPPLPDTARADTATVRG